MITHIHYFLKIFLLLLFHNSSCLNNLRHFYPSNAQRSQIDDDMSKYIFCHGDLQRLYLDSHSDIRIDKGGLQNTSYVQGARGRGPRGGGYHKKTSSFSPPISGGKIPSKRMPQNKKMFTTTTLTHIDEALVFR